jgi:hypothetical protein
MENSVGNNEGKEGAEEPPTQAPSPKSVLPQEASRTQESPHDPPPLPVSMGPSDFKQALEKAKVALSQLEESTQVSKPASKKAEEAPDAGKALVENLAISVPKISAEEWRHLFETTGLCQVGFKVLQKESMHSNRKNQHWPIGLLGEEGDF